VREGSIHWLRLEGVPGVDVMDVRGVSRKWNHHHETYTVCVRTPEGRCPSASWLYRRREHVMRPGGIMLMEPGEFHTNTHPAPVADFSVVMIERDRMLELLARAQGVSAASLALRAPQLYSAELEAKVQAAVAHLAGRDGPAALDTLVEFVDLLCGSGVFERRFGDLSAAGPDDVRRAVELIQDRWSDPVAVTDLVAELGVPASTLSHAFRKKVGMGLRQYRKRVRLERCRRLLRDDPRPIADIAGSCGYVEPTTFCHEFKDFFGVTPSQYRRGTLRTCDVAAPIGPRRSAP